MHAQYCAQHAQMLQAQLRARDACACVKIFGPYCCAQGYMEFDSHLCLQHTTTVGISLLPAMLSSLANAWLKSGCSPAPPLLKVTAP